ncbi:MAG: uroporphyrinogen-III C-methyltransferase [Planctomycetia bacterium]|nr:uroporphyrinogen-III C-methyltransferase [Planctomycetia bacterium]
MTPQSPLLDQGGAGGKSPGCVYLVGAGPGDPGLLTLRGLECLRRADVVLYDYLVNPRILTYAAAGAELVCLGRHGRDRIVPQAEINNRMIAEARAGRCVVRLKGGDPAIFARAAEEAQALAEAGVRFEIVPGITAALAASSYAEVALTHRDTASAVALVTGHQQEGEPASTLDYAALAAFPGTLVFYMGVTTARHWSNALIDAGRDAATPAVIVRRCSWPDQQTIHCTLGTVADDMASRKLRPPALVVVGDSVGSAAGWAASGNWFEQRPLFGRTVLVTRPADQSIEMCDQLAELGARTLVQPAITIGPPPDWQSVDAALTRLHEFDWLVFSSANGVQWFFHRLLEQHGDLRRLGNIKLAAIGPQTAAALSGFHLKANMVPAEEYRAESLAAALVAQSKGQRFLLARASRGRELLASELTAAGGAVTQVVVYQSDDVTTPDAEIAAALTEGQIDWLTVTSSAIARSVVNLFGETLRQTRLVSISPITSATLRELGHAPAIEATEYTTAGIIAAILRDKT